MSCVAGQNQRKFQKAPDHAEINWAEREEREIQTNKGELSGPIRLLYIEI